MLLASDGEEAWQAIRQHQPDILVTDCQMPHLNGLQLAERIHQTPETAHLPVIMLSAKGFELQADEICRQFGIRAILAKPFSPRELFQRVEAELAASSVAAQTSV